MGEATIALSSDSLEAAFAAYKSHFNGHRTCTEMSMLDHFRKAYPDYHVICTTPHRCDLHGYAKAGLAVMNQASTELLDITRAYKGPSTRLSGEPGRIQEKVRFACWDYAWSDFRYLVFETDTINEKGQSATADELMMAVGAWSTQLHDEIFVFDEGSWSKSPELYKSVQTSSWADVILNPATKCSLITDIQSFFSNRELYKKLAVPWKRGLIFHGLPGNGKTITIKALIKELAAREDPVPSLYVKNFDACQGEKYSIKEIFSQARTVAPCLLVFEDLDSLVTDETRSYFLNEVDGLESNDGILMIGSTNNLSLLDPAISKRPSRFDRKYHFKLPSLTERTAYCQFWRSKLVDSDLVDFPEDSCEIIARLSEGFSFAYLKEMFVIALLTIARGGKNEEDITVLSAGGPDEDAKGHSTESDLVEGEVLPEGVAEKDVSDKEGSIDDKAMEVGILSWIAEEGGGTDPSTNAIPLPTSTTTVETAKPTAAEPNKSKRVLPEIDIPDHLRENILLRVIKDQLKILLEEMDSTKEEDWPSEKRQGGGVVGAKPRRMKRVGRSIFC